MSVEFTITGLALSREEWDALLVKWAKGHRERLYFVPRLNDEESPAALILGEGSVRGARLIGAADGAVVQLSSMASRADWRYAFSLMAAIGDRSGAAVKDESGAALEADGLTEARADERGLATLRRNIASFREAFRAAAGEGSARLPVSLFEIPLSAADLPEGEDPSAEAMAELESSLAFRVSSYARAVRAKTFVLESGARLSSWGLEPTLVYQADYIVLREAVDPIPLSVVITALGERAEACGQELWYLPAIDPEEDAEILEAIVAGEEQVPGFEKGASSDEQEREKISAAVSEILSGSSSSLDDDDDDDDDGADDDDDGFVETEAASSVGSGGRAGILPGDATKIALDCLVSGMLSSEDPDAVAERLKTKLSIPADTMDLLVAVTAQTLRELFGVNGEPKPIEEVCDQLLADGVSEPLVKMVVSSIYKELSTAE